MPVMRHASTSILIVVLALLQPCFAGSDHKKHGSLKRQQAWQKVLARPSRAVTVAVDDSGTLWRIRVLQGQMLLGRSKDQGSSFVDEIKVNQKSEAVAANGENRPKLAFGPKGEIFISWTRLGSVPFSGDIRFSRSVDGGRHFSKPVTINSHTGATGHRFDAMIVDGSNRLWLFWLDKRDMVAAKKSGKSYAGAAVYYTRSDDAGKSFSANKKLQDHSCQCCRIALGVTSKSVPVAVWRHIFSGGERDHALQFVDGKSAMQRLSNEHWKINACPHHGPSLAVDSEDRVHTVWFSGAANHTGLYYSASKRTRSGIHSSTPMRFGDPKAQSSHPYIFVTGVNVFVVWKEFHQGRSVIRMMQSHDSGKSWPDPRTLLSTDGPSDHPLLTGGDSKVYLTWNTDKQGLQVLPIHPARSN
ncbi:MAG: exo-alpha-sialidase [Proteobacteria bacterium]|nr:exo-alpha-sialidase [Pseudomonadota bacterium]